MFALFFIFVVFVLGFVSGARLMMHRKSRSWYFNKMFQLKIKLGLCEHPNMNGSYVKGTGHRDKNNELTGFAYTYVCHDCGATLDSREGFWRQKQ